MSNEGRIRYTIVGGFLGAGKTTLINGMLATATERLAVIVNDIGEINVDAALIRSVTTGRGGVPDTIELTNGCVCCSIGDSLALTLRDLCSTRPRLQHIVLECSGVADPVRAGAYGSRKVLAEPVIVVVADATDIRPRAADQRFADLIRAQLAGADLVVLTKTDLVDDPDPVSRWLSGRTDAPVAVGRPDRLGAVIPHRKHRANPGPTPVLRVETRYFDRPVDVDELQAWLEATDGLIRAKGLVETIQGPLVVQWSGGRFTTEPWSGPVVSSSVVTIA